MDFTRKLKARLWQKFGTDEMPAEWDGRVYGGGKLSQRYWEYFKSLELLELDEDSVVIDIGGGSPTTGIGFFSWLISDVVRQIHVFDPHAVDHAPVPANVEMIRQNATAESLKPFLQAHPEITHITCISVFEHIEPQVREDMIRTIDQNFSGRMFVATFEFHARHNFFEHQLTAHSVSDLFEPFDRFFPDEICASPVWCENAYDESRFFRHKSKGGKWIDNGFIPQWYPVAVRFVPVDDGDAQ